MSRPKSEKKPKSAFAPRGDKSPRVERDPSVADQLPSWAFGLMDPGGAWGWALVGTQAWHDVIVKLSEYETMTWAEIDGPSGSHFVAVADIEKPAKERLVHLQFDDVDELFSLRLTGPGRIWGIRVGAVLRLLWWDPKHEVCPSDLKNT